MPDPQQLPAFFRGVIHKQSLTVLSWRQDLDVTIVDPISNEYAKVAAVYGAEDKCTVYLAISQANLFLFQKVFPRHFKMYPFRLIVEQESYLIEAFSFQVTRSSTSSHIIAASLVSDNLEHIQLVEAIRSSFWIQSINKDAKRGGSK